MSQKDMQKKEAVETVAAERMHHGPTFVPPVDIVETKDGYVLTADMPGVEAKEIQINYERDTLSLRAIQSPTGAAGEWVSREYEPGAYERVFTVSGQIDAGKIGAQYVNGVLTLTLPKAEAAKPRTITVSSA